MAVYTNPSATSSYVLTTAAGTQLVADITSTGSDAYAKILTIRAGGSVDDLTLTAKGSALVSNGGVINDLHISNSAGTPRLLVYNGGTVKKAEATGTVEFWISKGGLVEDVTINAGAYAILYESATLVGGTYNGGALLFITSKAVASNLTIKKTTSGGSRDVLSGGTMRDCTIAAGGIYSISGGITERLLVSGANARFFASGGTMTDTILRDGGAVTARANAIMSNTTVSGGVLTVSAGTVDGVNVFAGGKAIVSSGATVTGIVESGGYVSVATGATVTFVETDLTGYTFTTSATVHAATIANDVTIADQATLYVCASSGTVMAHASVDGVTVQDGGTLAFTEGVWGWGSANWAFASNVTVESGGAIAMKNFVRLLDVTAVSGAVLKRESNRVGFGGENTNIAKGVISDNGFGEDFEVVNGVATGFCLSANTDTGRSCGDFQSGLTFKDAAVVSGGSLYLYDGAKIDGIDVYGQGGPGGDKGAYLWLGAVSGGNVRIGSGASALFNDRVDLVLDSVDISGGVVTVANGALDNLTISSGGIVTVSKGTHGTVAIGSGGVLNLKGGAIEELTISANDTVSPMLAATGGTIDNLKVVGGRVLLSGNATVEYLDIRRGATAGAMAVGISGGNVTINGGRTSGSYEFRMEAGGGTINDMTVSGGTYVFWSAGYANGVTFASNTGKLRFNGSNTNALTLENCIIYKGKEASDNRGLLQGRMIDCTIGQGGYLRQAGGSNTGMTISGGTLDVSAGVVSSAMVRSGGALLLSGGTARDIALSGGVYGSSTVSGAVTSTLLSATTATIYSGATVSGALIEDYAVIQVNSGAVLLDPILRMNSPSVIKNKYARINVGYDTTRGGVVSGGTIAGNGNTIEFYIYAGGVASDVTFCSGNYTGVVTGGLISGGTMKAGTLSVRGGDVRELDITGGSVQFYAVGGTLDGITVRNKGTVTAANANAVVRNATFVSGGFLNVTAEAQTADNVVSAGGSAFVSHGGKLTGTIIRDGGFVKLVSGATIADTTISSGGYLEAAGSAKQGAVDGLTVLSGGKFLLTANSAHVNGLAAEAGAVISLSFTNAGSATAAAFDTLENCDATIELLNVGTATKTFNVAAVGNTDQRFAMVGSSVFEGSFKAGDVYVDPFTQQQLTVAADATTVSVEQYVRTTTDEAATFATSGSVINGGDKELMWDGATVTGAVKLIDADTAAAMTGDAWLDVRACAAGSGAAIYGTDVNVNFAGKVQYQFHGGGDTVGNFAGGANYGGSVKGVDMLTYNTTYTGVGYAGGFGTVQNEVEVVFAGGNTLDKDFYGGALYNANKVAASTTTGVGRVKMTVGEKTTDSIAVKGNLYGASAVKAGTVTTVDNMAAFHTVGDVSLTLRAGTLADRKCVFAGGYATGHDEAGAAAVYTVDSVTVNVLGGDWGLAHGGRGIFGGAMASDNLVNGSEAAGVYARVGDVDLAISGGTMGNVYGGGWAQKNARSEVGDVNITIAGGTVANVFGGGSHSTSGGTTVAGNVTITVSGGTISNAIYARGQLDGDVTGTASVIFTGNRNFSFADGVYGYSYVGGEAGGATLSFSGYTGTFSGAVGGFDGITLDGATAMTLGAEAEVNNTAWTFDAAERDAAKSGTAFLNWGAADFAGDSITLNLAGGSTTEWTLVDATASTVYNKFDVLVDGTSILSETLDLGAAIADTGTAYDGWGFTLDSGTLKFKQLA